MLLRSTVLISLLILPGSVALSIALGPRSRASRRARLAPRLLLSLVFSCAIWATWLVLFGSVHGDAIVNTLVEGPSHITTLGKIARLEGPTVWLALALVSITLVTGFAAASIHESALRGLALTDFPVANPTRRQRTMALAWRMLAKFHLDHLVRPAGAAYAIVVRRALLEAHGVGVFRLYVDVLQGTHEDKSTQKNGTLYTGELDHIACADDGGIAAVVLREAQRLGRRADSDSQREPWPLGWSKIKGTRAFVISGEDTRNVNFRFFQQPTRTSTLIQDLLDSGLKLRTR